MLIHIPGGQKKQTNPERAKFIISQNLKVPNRRDKGKPILKLNIKDKGKILVSLDKGQITYKETGRK